MATTGPSNDLVEELEYEETTDDNLEGKLGRGADFGHPRIAGANSGYRARPYPYKQDKYSPPHPPQYPVEYHQDHIYPIEETFYESEGGKYSEDSYSENKYSEDNYYPNEETYHKKEDQQVSLETLKSVLTPLLDDLVVKFEHVVKSQLEAHIKSQKCPKRYHSDQGSCDPSKWSKCTCLSPAEFTDDGRGNCNLGAIKADTQVWCYVEDSHGDPAKLCPDSKPSNSKHGYYWSRYACIT